MRNNNKEIISLLARRSYRDNHMRNTILIGAVAFVVLMLFCVFSLSVGKIETDILLYTRNGGTAANTTLEYPTQEQYEQIQELSYIKSVGKSIFFGTADEYSCVVLDENAWKEMQVPAYSDMHGTYPQEKYEIMLPIRALDALGISKPALGMEIPVSIDLQNGEELTHTFTLSGYYTEYVDPMYGAPDGYFSEDFLRSLHLDTDENTTLLIRQDDNLTDETIENMLYRDVTMRDDSQQFIGGNSMTWQAVYDLTGGFDTAFLLAAVIVLSAWLLIYNILHISLSHDIRKYGLLKTLGTTKAQLRAIVFRQIRTIVLLGSLIGAILGAVITLTVIPALLSKMYLHGFGNASAMIAFRPLLLICAVASGALVTLLSSMLAVARVTRLSPIQSVKYMEKVSGKRRTRPTYSSERLELIKMSWRNILRFRKRFFITVLSLSLGIIVSLEAVIISKGTDTTNQINYETADFEISSFVSALDCDLLPSDTELIPSSLQNTILGLSGIQEKTLIEGGYGKVAADEEYLELRADNQTDESGQSTKLRNFVVQKVSDEYLSELKEFAEKENLYLDVDSVIDGSGIIMLHYHLLSQIEIEKSKYTVGLPASIYDLNGEKRTDMTFCGYLDFKKKGLPELATTANGPSILYFLVSESGFRKMNLKEQTFGMDLTVDPEKEPVLKDSLTRLINQFNQEFSESGTTYDNVITDSRTLLLTSKSDILADAQDYIRSSRLIMGAVCILLILMGLVNYANVTATGFTVRRKEFAVLESIGLTRKQLRKMLLWEGIFYSLIITLLTAGPGSIISHLTNILIKKRIAYFTFRQPYVEFLLCILALFTVCILVPLILYRQYKKESLVDRLRIYAD